VHTRPKGGQGAKTWLTVALIFDTLLTLITAAGMFVHPKGFHATHLKPENGKPEYNRWYHLFFGFITPL